MTPVAAAKIIGFTVIRNITAKNTGTELNINGTDILIGNCELSTKSTPRDNKTQDK